MDEKNDQLPTSQDAVTNDDTEAQSINEAQNIPVLAALLLPIIEILQGDPVLMKREQVCNIALMLTILGAIVYLGTVGVLDSSGTTGLMGAITGYVFGSFFHKGILKA